MLSVLRIKNLALVDDLTVELLPGFNAITGETGAGKSILLGAVKLLTGGRADRGLLREGEDLCTVEAVFELGAIEAAINKLLDQSGLEPCSDGQLMIRRAFSRSGTNRQFVNGSPTTLQVLSNVGSRLVDLHGPHDNQSLLRPAAQLEMVDAFAGLDAMREEFAALMKRRSNLIAEKSSLEVDDRTVAQQMDLLRYQIDEIEKAQFETGDEEAIAEELTRGGNVARISEIVANAAGVLNGHEGSLLDLSGTLGQLLAELESIEPQARGMGERHEEAVERWRDLVGDLSNLQESVEIDPYRLEELENRFTLLQSFKRKYGSDIASILDHQREAMEKLSYLEGREASVVEIDASLAKLEKDIRRKGRTLSLRRLKALPELGKRITEQLRELGFNQSKFAVNLQPAPKDQPLDHVGVSGFDRIEFEIAPNPGEPARNLRSIASSGEMARVMLAIKVVFAEADCVPVLIFDEIDSNVGGETASVVGRKMKQIGESHQAICVTHLPSVAAESGSHLLVSKRVVGGRTLTAVTGITGEKRVDEISRMLGGKTKAAKKHAVELLRGQENGENLD